MQHRALAVMTLALAACAPTTEPTASARASIIGGVDSTAADDAVVLLHRTYGTWDVCTGTLVAPNLVVTARHCIVAVPPQDGFICQTDGTLKYSGAGELGESAPANSIEVFAGASVESDGTRPTGTPAALGSRIFTTSSPSVCRDDIAYVVLDTSLTLPTATLRLNRRVEPYDFVSTVGYGWTETTPPGTQFSPIRKRRDHVRVLFAGLLPSTFTLGRSVCKGDSGAPALDGKSGDLVGVYSLGFPGTSVETCSSEESVNYYVQVADYPDLLAEAFAFIGQPVPSGSSSASGGGAGGGGGGVSSATSSGQTSSGTSGAGGSGGSGGGAGSGGVTGGCAITKEPSSRSAVTLWALGLCGLYGWKYRGRRRRKP